MIDAVIYFKVYLMVPKKVPKRSHKGSLGSEREPIKIKILEK